MGLRLAQDDLARDSRAGTFGRYSLHDAIAVGEVSSVHLGLLEGASGFRKPVAFKRLQPSYVYDRAEIARLTYEACVLAHIHHPNVIQVLDLVETGESYLVMEYVLGETLAGLVKSGARCSIPIAVAIMSDVLRGIEASHSARGAAGQSLRVVHRNVCPENLLVGVDGVTRVLDFGSALSTTGTRTLLRDLPPNVGYAAPEQLMQQPVDRRADIFSAGVVLWEALTGKRLFRSTESRDAFLNGTSRNILPASAFNAEVPRSLDEVVFRALGWLPEERFDTAGEFAQELELAVSPASRAEITAYVEKKAAPSLKSQRALLSAIDAPSGRISEPPGSSSPEGYEDETVVFRPDHHLLHLGVPTRKGTASVPAPLDVLRERLSTALERDSSASLFGFTSRVSGSLRRSARRVGSNVLAAAAAVLLLLAAVKLSRGTPSLAPDAVPSPAQPAPEPARANQEPNQPARRVAAASIDFTPPDPWEKVEPARPAAEPAPAPPAETNDRDRPRAKAIVRRAPAADRGSCDPPFTVDSSGIKRLKVHCL